MVLLTRWCLCGEQFTGTEEQLIRLREQHDLTCVYRDKRWLTQQLH
jgi:hypothetical protein